MDRSKTADEFIFKHQQWQEILTFLRDILLSTGLEETIKWGVPVYTLDGKNVVGLTAFKNHVAIWFMQGALLKDPAGVLVNAQEGTTRAQRQLRFDSMEGVDKGLIEDYLAEAIENQKKGKVVKPVKKQAFSIPPELSDVLSGDNDLDAPFRQLTSYKQREFAEYIADAKRADTKSRRLEKIIPMIRNGTGLNDKYRR